MADMMEYRDRQIELHGLLVEAGGPVSVKTLVAMFQMRGITTEAKTVAKDLAVYEKIGHVACVSGNWSLTERGKR